MAMHPDDARRLKAAEGMTVRVRLNGSTSPVLIHLDETLPVGFAILPRSMGIPIDGPTPVEIQVAEPAMV
jgi:hypothetical protein